MQNYLNFINFLCYILRVQTFFYKHNGMKRVLLLQFFLLFAIFSYGQSLLKDWSVIGKVGFNALDQSSRTEAVIPKSALGYQVGIDAIKQGNIINYKFGFLYQSHEIIDIKNRQSAIISSIETTGRKFRRIKLTGGATYNILNYDFLNIGVGTDLGYNIGINQPKQTYLEYLNSVELDYLSSIFHLFFDIKKIHIGAALEGNLISFGQDLSPFQSKTYSLSLGYIF